MPGDASKSAGNRATSAVMPKALAYLFGIAKTGAAAEGSYSRDRSARKSATVLELAMSCGRQRLGVWRASANFRQFVFAIVCARWMALHISPVKCLKMLKSREAGLLIEHQEVDRARLSHAGTRLTRLEVHGGPSDEDATLAHACQSRTPSYGCGRLAVESYSAHRRERGVVRAPRFAFV